MTDLSEVTRQAADEGKCYDAAMRDIKLPKYEKYDGYAQYLPGNIERFCYFWNGIRPAWLQVISCAVIRDTARACRERIPCL